jgi:hypothetical protein
MKLKENEARNVVWEEDKNWKPVTNETIVENSRSKNQSLETD